ncbi:Alpha/Beta hydrolase protein [Phakopsora pachyrhizi]|nr:Alpha/Beta hydrolase protein [Phakopsora pachyrhizi]
MPQIRSNVTTRSLPISSNSFGESTSEPKRLSSIKFNSPEARRFYVDGTQIPFVDWDAGPSYAGLMPVSNKPNEPRKFFFWFWPAQTAIGTNELTFWTNGGPGCSSLESLLQETGPISWQYGQAKPTRNPQSWTLATSMLYVEQPIGTGYSEGTPQAFDQTDVSRDLFGFFLNWLSVFPEMRNKNFYLSGESYAGYYLPYFADYIFSHQNSFPLKLQGTFLASPSLSWDVLRTQISIVPYVKRYEYVFAFNRTFMNKIEKLHEDCGYEEYLSKYLTYPPEPAPFPIPSVGTFHDDEESDHACDLSRMVSDAARRGNEGSNYNILDTPPAFWDVLDAPQRWPGLKGDAVYFNREDVKKILHVPVQKEWKECQRGVFPHGDHSTPPALSVLPGVIENSKRTIIVTGQTDSMILFNGVRVALQNMTWGGDQGFRSPIENDFIIDGKGYGGRYSTERGLTYAELEKCGHMVPQYQPQASLQLLRYLIGQDPSPSAAWT